MTTSYYQNLIRNLRLIVKCGICGHKQKLQFHHIKPTKLNGESRGQNKRFRDIVAHPDCYIPLCYFCHQKVTLGEWAIIHAWVIQYQSIMLSLWDDDGWVKELHVI